MQSNSRVDRTREGVESNPEANAGGPESSTSRSAGLVQNMTIKICDYIKKETSMTPKEFIQSLLDSEVPGVSSRRQFWATQTGWPSTEQLILSIKKRVIESEKKDGTDRWSTFILNEVGLFTI